MALKMQVLCALLLFCLIDNLHSAELPRVRRGAEEGASTSGSDQGSNVFLKCIPTSLPSGLPSGIPGEDTIKQPDITSFHSVTDALHKVDIDKMRKEISLTKKE